MFREDIFGGMQDNFLATLEEQSSVLTQGP